jgi:peptidoglycan hydrolase CwlO-like protein
MKKMLVLVCMMALGFLLALAAFDDSSAQSAESEGVKAELEQLKAALANTESERDNLKVKVTVEQRDREQLQAKVDELTRSREQLQRQVEKFSFTCDQSRQQLAEIIKTRDELKKQVAELSDTRDKLQRRYDIVAASHNQLSKQVEGLTASRDEAVAKAQTTQKRIEMLVATPDPEKRESRGRQERLTVTNKVQEETQPPTVEISEYRAASTKLGRPAVIPGQVGGRPAVLTEVIKPAAVDNRLKERPTCHSFNATHPRIMPGQTSILSWQVSNADRIRIEPDIGPVSVLGSVAVKPSTATTYNLIAANQAGESIRTCRVEIGKGLAIGSNGIHSRILLEQDTASSDSKVLSGQQPPVGEPSATLGKFLGYRARRDESGKLIFVPVFENKQEE